jgi:hypothetical protein
MRVVFIRFAGGELWGHTMHRMLAALALPIVLMKRVLSPALLLGGCAYTTSSTEVTPAGPDTYMVGASAGQYAGGMQQGQSLALQKANGYCQSRSLAVRVVGIQPQPGGATIMFRCIAQNDPENTRPTPGQNINVNVR